MEKLSKEEVLILDSLGASSGTLERLSYITKIEENILSHILEKFEKMELVKRIKSGKDDEIDFWFTTKDGDSYIGKNYMRNEFGDLIDWEDVANTEDRIVSLTDNLIDELYFRCGFIFAGHTMKALSQKEIDEIRKDSKFVEGLLLETPMDELLRNLDDIENDQ
jgi:DNA-binding MarR family transcriptional regulator